MTILEAIFQPIMILPVGAGVTWVLWRKGVFTRAALRRGPDRSIGLGGADLLIVLGLLVLGVVMFGAIAPALWAVDSQTGQLSSTSAMEKAGQVIVGQLLQQGPAVAYIVWRAASAWRISQRLAPLSSPQDALPSGQRARWGLRRIGYLPFGPCVLGWAAMGWLAAIPLVFSLLTLSSIVAALLGHPPPEFGHKLLKTMADSHALAPRVVLMLEVVLVAPLLEESIFRGLLQSVLVERLGRRRRWGAVAIAATLFGLTHLLGAEVPFQALPGLIALGGILGWLYERTGSLWPNILVHGGFNAFNLALVWLFK